jgi:F0F1-type ATP synthase assembly protein I
MATTPPIEFRVVVLQGVCVGIAVVLATLVAGRDQAIPAVLGGGCAVLPNAFMALRARRRIVPGTELASAAGLFLAMFTKLGLTVLLLALALRQIDADHGAAFFAGFLVALLAHHASFLMEDASHEGAPPPRPEPDVDDDR